MKCICMNCELMEKQLPSIFNDPFSVFSAMPTITFCTGIYNLLIVDATIERECEGFKWKKKEEQACGNGIG